MAGKTNSPDVETYRDAMRRDKQTQTVNFGGQATKSTRWMPWH